MNALLRKVLKQVNQARVLMGYKPLKKLRRGQIMQTNSCPLVKSLPKCDAVYGSDGLRFSNTVSEKILDKLAKKWGVDRGGYYLDATPEMIQFIDDFDDEIYPELEIK